MSNLGILFCFRHGTPGEQSTFLVRGHGEGKGIVRENERSTRCVMRGKLAWCFRALNTFRANDFTECLELFGRCRPASKQFHSSISHCDDCRFNSVEGWSCIDNERNPPIEFVEDIRLVNKGEGGYAEDHEYFGELARKHAVETPIIEEVYAMLYEGKDVRKAVQDLTARESSGMPSRRDRQMNRLVKS